MDDDNKLYLLLGKLDGKLDSLMTAATATSARVDDVEKRVLETEKSITTIKARHTYGKSWLSTIISVAALGVAVVSNFLKGGAG